MRASAINLWAVKAKADQRWLPLCRWQPAAFSLLCGEGAVPGLLEEQFLWAGTQLHFMHCFMIFRIKRTPKVPYYRWFRREFACFLWLPKDLQRKKIVPTAGQWYIQSGELLKMIQVSEGWDPCRVTKDIGHVLSKYSVLVYILLSKDEERHEEHRS